MIAEKLKESIIQSGVQGKFELSNSNDEKLDSYLDKVRLIANSGNFRGKKYESQEVDNTDYVYDVPEHWKWIRLSELVSYTNGYPYSKSDMYSKQEGHPVIKSQNIGKKKVLIDIKTDFVKHPNDKMLKSNITKGDLLMVLSSQSSNVKPLGVTAIYDIEEDALLNQRVLRLTPFANEITRFLFYFINSDGFHQVLSHKSGGSAQANLKLGHVLDMFVALPPLAEQKRIVEKLDHILPMIDALEKDEAKLQEIMTKFPNDMKASILQAAIQGELTERILEDLIETDPTKELKAQKLSEALQDEYGLELPDQWKLVSLQDLFDISTGLSFKREQKCQQSIDTVRVLRGGNILPGNYFFLDTDIFVKNDVVKNDKLFLAENDIITPSVTSLENVGKFARIDQTYDNVVAGGFVFVLRPKISNELFSRYLLYALSSRYLKKEIQAITNKSGQAFYNIGKSKLSKIILPIPPLAEQKRIVDKLDQLLPLIDSLKGQINEN